jgi:hypothetical protein
MCPFGRGLVVGTNVVMSLYGRGLVVGSYVHFWLVVGVRLLCAFLVGGWM